MKFLYFSVLATVFVAGTANTQAIGKRIKNNGFRLRNACVTQIFQWVLNILNTVILFLGQTI